MTPPSKVCLLAVLVWLCTNSTSDVTSCQRALFEWADSFDTKDWGRLRECLGPAIRVSVTITPSAPMDQQRLTQIFVARVSSAVRSDDTAKTADEFVGLVSSQSFLGNPLIKTQHFVGVGKWQKLSDDTIEGTHQIRVAHQRYVDDTLQAVQAKGHDHGLVTMWFKKVGALWKCAGLRPSNYWSEFDREKIFA